MLPHQMTRRGLLQLVPLTMLPAVAGFAPQEREHALDAVTLGVLTDIGREGERAFNLRAERTSLVTVQGRTGRRSAAWFSYDVPVDRSNAVAVVVTYNTALAWFCWFTVSVDGVVVAEEYMPPRQTEHFFDAHYGVPSGVASGKDVITVRFDALRGDEIAPVFGVRSIRA